ncbi:MAG: Holliday junction branch migration protein RuvA [Candidatus Pacebacteria bacterium]|nr:Holliday junction branch migration protein RuvA [Candidatus Paceibacterota bacterium]
MIAHLFGNVIELADKYTVLDVHGVGYKVYCSTDTLGGLKQDSPASLFTYLAVREDALDLYGFGSSEEKNFFELLLSVSGIGPRSALGILSATTVETLKKAIGTGDTSYLTKVSGIGRKTAEKVVLELRDKLRAHVDMKETPHTLRAESDVVEALKSLGYSQNEARDALKEVPSEIAGTNARIKEALKILGQK